MSRGTAASLRRCFLFFLFLFFFSLWKKLSVIGFELGSARESEPELLLFCLGCLTIILLAKKADKGKKTRLFKVTLPKKFGQRVRFVYSVISWLNKLTQGEPQLCVSMCVCLSVCVSVYHGLSLPQFLADFDETWTTWP